MASNPNEPLVDASFIHVDANANSASQEVEKTQPESSSQSKPSSPHVVISIPKFENAYKWLEIIPMLVTLWIELESHQNLFSKVGSNLIGPLMGLGWKPFKSSPKIFSSFIALSRNITKPFINMALGMSINPF